MPFMHGDAAKFWAVIVGWWTLYGLLLAGQLLGMEDAQGRVMPAAHALRLGLVSGLMWVPMTALLWWWVQRWPVERRRLVRSLAAAFGLVLLLVLLRALAVVALDPWIGWYQQMPGFASVLWASFGNNFLLLWLMVGVAHVWLYARHARAREREAEQLQARLTETRLEALSAQLNPHFMFNTLNSIAEMVHRDADAADRMLVSLGELLRSSLDHQRSQLVPLREELRLLRHYLDIEKMRLGERLQLQWRIEAGVDDLLVPPLVLQPLAENAVLHAIAGRSAPGTLRVLARQCDRGLLLEIADCGGGGGVSGHRGTGLRNIRSRLQCLYGNDQALEIVATADGGTSARLRLPLRREEAPA